MALMQVIIFAVTLSAALAECAGDQCLNHDDDVASLLQAYTQVKKRDAEAPHDDCLAGVKRFEDVCKQHMTHKDVGKDPMFPPDLTSIAAEGEDCGDTAHGISKSCDKYNHWKTMQDVHKAMGLKTFITIPDTNEMDYTDIGQGELGNCYFLAATAAVANHHAKVLHDVFPAQGDDANIFTVQLFINGKWSKISVDNMIPAGANKPFFTQPSKDGEWWPVILAKAWAKVFGSFKAVESGTAETVVTALTGAPVTSINHDSNGEAHNWDLLKKHSRDKFVMIAGSRNNAEKYGLASGHAYAVLEVKEDFKSYGNVVQLMNPWRHDNYNGKVPNTEEINGPNFKFGVFTMLFSEYNDAFESTGVAKVQDGYTARSVEVDTDKPFVFEVTNPKKVTGPFEVSIVWPNHRMLRPCSAPSIESPPSIVYAADVNKLAAGRAEGKKLMTTNEEDMYMEDVNSFTQQLTNKRGSDYATLMYAKFPTAEDYIKKIQMVVYGPSALEISLNTKWTPEAIAIESMTPGKACTNIMVPGEGMFVRDDSKVTMPGVPTFWSVDKKQFLYLADLEEIKWGRAVGSWWKDVVSHPSEGIVIDGSENIPKEDLKCGCEDQPEGVPGLGALLKCDEATSKKPKYANVHCSDAENGSHVRQACPKTCGICGK